MGYDGCHRPELTIPSQCNFGGGCIHGTIDENCKGVADLAQYEGMENFDGSNELPYCFTIPQMGNVAMKFANCPPPPIMEEEKQEELQEDDEVYVEEENGEEKGNS